MTGLDIFAVFILCVLVVTAVVAIAVLGALPGRVARSRQHPYTQAISVAGWVSLIFGGLLWPLALVWAYAPPRSPAAAANSSDDIESLRQRVARLEAASATHREVAP